MNITAFPHDPEICGISPETDCPKCRPRTVSYQRRQDHLQRLDAIAQRLAQAGIDVDDFADMLWMRIQPALEEEVKKIMLDTIKMAMKDLRVIGRLEGTWWKKR